MSAFLKSAFETADGKTRPRELVFQASLCIEIAVSHALFDSSRVKPLVVLTSV